MDDVGNSSVETRCMTNMLKVLYAQKNDLMNQVTAMGQEINDIEEALQRVEEETEAVTEETEESVEEPVSA